MSGRRLKSLSDLGAILTRPKEDTFPTAARAAASRKEKGGSPEDARRGNKTMLNVVEQRRSCNVGTDDPLFSQANVAEARRARAYLADRIERARHEGSLTETINLTPVLAELLLERNPENRNIRQQAIDIYRTDIENGDWTFNGEAIKLSDDGLLNDGQHRCKAVIAAARPIRTNITFGLTRDSRMTVDQGAVRTAGNYLSMAGYKDGNHLAAVASLIWQFENFGRFAGGSRDRPTKAQVGQTAKDHPKIYDSLLAVPAGGTKVATKSVLAFCHYQIARRAGIHAANAFILNLCLGGVPGVGNPINRIRDRLLNEGKKMHSAEKIELIFRGWNAHRKNRSMGKSSPLLGEIPALER